MTDALCRCSLKNNQLIIAIKITLAAPIPPPPPPTLTPPPFEICLIVPTQFEFIVFMNVFVLGTNCIYGLLKMPEMDLKLFCLFGVPI